MSYNKPLPTFTPVNEPFWTFARQGVFALQFCNACADVRIPGMMRCARCLSNDQAWRPVSGKGRLESWIDFHHAYWDAFRPDLPYRVCLVQLDEGPLFISTLIDDNGTVCYGAPLIVVFDKVTETVTLPRFALAT